MDTFKNIIWKVISLFNDVNKPHDKMNTQLSFQEGKTSRQPITT